MMMSVTRPFDEQPLPRRPAERTLPRPLPIGSVGHRTPAWWGIVGLIATECALFAYLLFSYFYLQSQDATGWPPSGNPPLDYSVPTTAALLVSAFTIGWAERGIRLGSRPRMFIGLIVTLLLGALYIILQWLDWKSEPFLPSSGAYGSLFYIITGFHLAHALVGLLLLVATLIWSAIGYITPQRYIIVTVAMLYWWFIVVVWIAVFLTLYALPYFGQH